MKWFRKAAEQGDAEAQYNLGVCYDDGEGVVKDQFEAIMWYRKAADQRNDKAQYNLGVCYANGEGVAKNEVITYQWWLLASANGNDDSKRYISILEKSLTAEQRAEGQRLATEWQAAFEKRQAGE